MSGVNYHVRSLTELVTKRAREQPDTKAVCTAPPPSSALANTKIVLRSLTYGQLERAVDRVAHYNASIGLLVPPVLASSPASELPPVPIVAVLVSNAVDVIILEIALAKAGLAALLLSVNNSPAAVAHLCKLTSASRLIYGPRYKAAAEEAKRIRHEDGQELEIIPERRFPLWGNDGVDTASIEPFRAVYTPQQERDRPAVILHSSGSTGFPKPVYITHYGHVANSAINRDRPGFSSLPVYHGFGHFSFFRCIYACKLFVLFPPHLPLTSSNIVKCLAVAPDTRECIAVPYVIKLLAETAEGIAALSKFDVVSCSGAALPDDLGDRLTAAGVNILSVYASTETGALMASTRDFAASPLWNWLRPSAVSQPYIKMEDRGGDVYECIVLDGYPPKIETNRPDGSYATKDLFAKHPTEAGLYKYVGRVDDTLVHTLGEKTNPLPIELAIRGNSPYVQEAIVFGGGRPHCGVLLNPSEQAQGLSVDEFKKLVWPVIEAANRDAPNHSALVWEMVEVLSEGTSVPVATKMSILRPACYVKFKNIIEKVYQRFEHGSGQCKLTITSESEMRKFVRGALASALGDERTDALDDDTDLFAAGVDSLQAGRVRNGCQMRLELGDATLGQNIVYEHPSIAKLATHLLAASTETLAPSADDHEHQMMLNLVDKYMRKLDQRAGKPSQLSPIPAVVVLTGATGSLGAHILAGLLASSAVEKIICLSRAKSHEESRIRLKDSLAQRKLSVPADFDAKVVSYSADVNEDLLGLTQAEYDDAKTSVTHVIHNAWPVNFSLSIASFDAHIGGVVNLMNLCLRSTQSFPANFYFSSSISACQGALDAECAEEFAKYPSVAGSTGYAQSKWTAEKICQLSTEQTPLRVGVLRIGQMAGDTVHGVWQSTEALPLLFRSAIPLRALPQLDENPSWLPVDIAGAAILEIVLRPEQPKAEVYHVVNPDVSTSWKQILDGVRAAGLEFDVVDRREWVKRLAASNSDGSVNPTYKLLPFYRQRYSQDVQRKPLYFLTHETAKASPSIASCPPLSARLIGKWMRSWQEAGFLA